MRLGCELRRLDFEPHIPRHVGRPIWKKKIAGLAVFSVSSLGVGVAIINRTEATLAMNLSPVRQNAGSGGVDFESVAESDCSWYATGRHVAHQLSSTTLVGFSRIGR